MRNWLVSLLGAAFLSGCANNGAATKHFERYQLLASQPTPEEWRIGAVWTFVTTDRRGAKETLTFRISDALAETCTSGDWRTLELLEGKAGSLAGIPSKPAALVEGRNLSINLTSNFCDVNNDLKGELLGGTFTGERSHGGIMGSTFVGNVQGHVVK